MTNNNVRNNVRIQGRQVLFSGPLTNNNTISFILINAIIIYTIFHDIIDAHEIPSSYTLLIVRLILNVVIFSWLKYIKNNISNINERVISMIRKFQWCQILFLIWIVVASIVISIESEQKYSYLTVNILNLLIICDFMMYTIYFIGMGCVNRNPYIGIRIMNIVGEFREPATESEINEIKNEKYSNKIVIIGNKSINLYDTKLCSICSDDFEDNENLKILQCGHFYHTHCIKEWFKQKFICPLCRFDLRNELNEELMNEVTV